MPLENTTTTRQTELPVSLLTPQPPAGTAVAQTQLYTKVTFYAPPLADVKHACTWVQITCVEKNEGVKYPGQLRQGGVQVRTHGQVCAFLLNMFRLEPFRAALERKGVQPCRVRNGILYWLRCHRHPARGRLGHEALSQTIPEASTVLSRDNALLQYFPQKCNLSAAEWISQPVFSRCKAACKSATLSCCRLCFRTFPASLPLPNKADVEPPLSKQLPPPSRHTLLLLWACRTLWTTVVPAHEFFFVRASQASTRHFISTAEKC